MRKVALFSGLLVLGMLGSQLMAIGSIGWLHGAVQWLTILCLGFIMIHVGYEFDIDRATLRPYAVDYGVAATAAAFPWLFAAAYFVWVMRVGPPGELGTWQTALLVGRFAAPTSAGILFAMLAAAGLSATWLFRKARVLAIFDDLDTVLLMIPLKMLIVGVRWQLGFIVVVMIGLLWLGWRSLHRVRAPTTWPWVLGYASAIALVSEVIHLASKWIDDLVPIHIEVLLPAFVLGCMLARPEGGAPHGDDRHADHPEASPPEEHVATIVSAAFMVLVGLSMPTIDRTDLDWRLLALHTVALTVLINAGKLFPVVCYRSEASWRERLALSIGMWPRGEVGAGVLVVSLAYGIGGPAVTVATLCLAFNLLCTGLFIYAVKALLRRAATLENGAIGATRRSA